MHTLCLAHEAQQCRLVGLSAVIGRGDRGSCAAGDMTIGNGRSIGAPEIHSVDVGEGSLFCLAAASVGEKPSGPCIL